MSYFNPMALVGGGMLVSNKFDISAYTPTGSSLDIDSEINGFAVKGQAFSPSGENVFVHDSDNPSIIYQYNCPIAFSTSGASYASKSLNIDSEFPSSSAHGLEFSSDGLNFYTNSFGGVSYQYTGGDAEDITTFSYSSKSYDLSSDISGMKPKDGVIMRGAKVFAVDRQSTSRVISAWSVSGNDITTLAYEPANSLDLLGILGLSTCTGDLWMSNDGVDLVAVAGASLYQILLSVPFDLTSATYTNKVLVLSDVLGPSPSVFPLEGKLFATKSSAPKSLVEYSTEG